MMEKVIVSIFNFKVRKSELKKEDTLFKKDVPMDGALILSRFSSLGEIKEFDGARYLNMTQINSFLGFYINSFMMENAGFLPYPNAGRNQKLFAVEDVIKFLSFTLLEGLAMVEILKEKEANKSRAKDFIDLIKY